MTVEREGLHLYTVALKWDRRTVNGNDTVGRGQLQPENINKK